ncbi:MAG: four helix bundle protein [Clostridia bacterium]
MENSYLKLIPKYEIYIEYVFNILNKLPKTEKFNIGNEFKCVIYSCFENIMYLNKVNIKYRMDYINKIDSEISMQRIFIRIMYKNKYIDLKKYSYSIELLNELGKMIGGYVKAIGINYGK